MEDKIKSIVEQMTLDEKIGQLNQVPINFDNIEKTKQDICDGKIGSIILANCAFAGNATTHTFPYEYLDELQKCALEKSRMKIPLIFGRDIIHGFEIIFPVPLAMAASFNPELIEKSYNAIADEAKNSGVQWAFAPMLDVCRDPRWGRCIEGPGEDPYVGAKVAEATVRGFQNRGVVACAKHYIGYGASEGGRDKARTEISDYSLHNFYLKAFEAAVKANVATVMTSFNEISGQPTNTSHYIMTEILRDQLGFKGFVVSDWMAIQQLERQGVSDSRAESSRQAISAGVDMDMLDECYIDTLKELVERGKLDESIIDTAVYRILKIKMDYIEKHPYTEKIKYDLSEHKDLSYKLASESMVLLKNKDNILPLDRKKRVLIIGPMKNEKRSLLGSWVPDYDLSFVQSYSEIMKSDYCDVKVVSSESSLESESIATIRNCDVVIACLGESYLSTGEQQSLTDIDMPEEQKATIRRAFMFGKPIIGIMNFGRPIALGDMENYFSAILYSWHSGTYTAKAALDIIYGKTNPSGKLPITVLRKTGQLPLYYNVTSSGRPANGYYGEEKNRNYNDCPGSPLYPFGYGLSYSKFDYSEITVDKDTISLEELQNGAEFKFKINVTNNSNFDGKEIVQLYVKDNLASMCKPLRELKGFDKKLIKSNQKAEFNFNIGFDELSFYNADKQTVVEKGSFNIYIGSNCLTENMITIYVN